MREYPAIIVPHMDLGDPECCGLIMAAIHGDQAELQCNECGAVLRTLPAAEAEKALAEMASDEMCGATCKHCGIPNTFPGFTIARWDTTTVPRQHVSHREHFLQGVGLVGSASRRRHGREDGGG
jgi:hypothetical protein